MTQDEINEIEHKSRFPNNEWHLGKEVVRIEHLRNAWKYIDHLRSLVKNHGDIHHVIKCPACGSDDLFKFKLEHIKCRECNELFEHSC